MTITYTPTILVDTGLIFNSDYFKINYLTDVPVMGQYGTLLQNDVIENKIRSISRQVETFLDLFISKQILDEKLDYDYNTFTHYGYFFTTYNINEILEIQSYVGDMKVYDWELSWINYSTMVDKWRTIYIIPNQLATFSSWFIYSHWAVYRGQSYLPFMLHTKYITGFNKIPYDILEIIAKMTLLQVFNILSMMLSPLGVLSSSKSIDGVSESRSYQKGMFKDIQDRYDKEIEIQKKELKDKYRGNSVVRI